MHTSMKFKLPDFDKMIDAITLTREDYKILASVIVENMAENIQSGIAADGRPLSQNSARWKASKLRQGKSPNPLQFTGDLQRLSSYQMKFTENSVSIMLIDSKRQIHLDLIEISEITGKNYEDWFGISKKARKKVYAIAKELIKEKLESM